MIELKFKSRLEQEKKASPSCCDSAGTAGRVESRVSHESCCSASRQDGPGWITGTVLTPVGLVNKVSADLTGTDYWEHFKCRTTAFRNRYAIEPGLYAVGDPDKNSNVLISANYKYSFDMLRRELKGLNVWILVLDTKGINVWCAAGKGTFSTDELIGRIARVRLNETVAHRRVIVPQLGAPGVSAFRVKQDSGFQVLYGPVRAKDIPAYIAAGHKATKAMRRINFNFLDRLVLTPLELSPVMKKFFLYALLIFAIFGLAPSGILFRDAFIGGLPFLLFGLVSVIAGALLTPMLLPFIPFRSFALKGWLVGLLSIYLSIKLTPVLDQQNTLLLIFTYLFFPLVSSCLALQFTGATTFTGITGVKKELKISVPLYIGGAAVSMIILIIYKLGEWRII
jgi:hypothetical protein